MYIFGKPDLDKELRVLYVHCTLPFYLSSPHDSDIFRPMDSQDIRSFFSKAADDATKGQEGERTVPN